MKLHQENRQGTLIRIVAVMAVLCLFPSLQAAPELVKDLSFYASFDQSIEPQFSRGAREAKGLYLADEGKIGKAVRIDADPPTYLPPGNFGCSVGTLAFWIKPSIDPALPSNDSDHTRGIFTSIVFALRAYVNHPTLKPDAIIFMTGDRPPDQDFAWDYETRVPLNSLAPNQWTHLALTWDRATGVKTIYINGKQAARTITRLIPPPDGGGGGEGDLIRLGDGLQGVYDELVIWRRVLSAAEIGKLAKDPAGTATVLNQFSEKQTDQQPNWVIYPSLVYLDYNNSLIGPGDALNIRLPLTNRTPQPQKGRIILSVIDVWGQVVGTPQAYDVSLDANADGGVDASFIVNKLGAFKIEAVVEVGGNRLLRDVTTFGCVPAGNPPTHPFFGGHISQVGTMPEMARRLGFSSNRVANMTQFTWWTRMELEQGQWAMDDYAAYQRYLDLGFTHLGQWFAAPYWAVTLPDGKRPEKVTGYPRGWVPTDEKSIRQYVRESLKRFPEIREWEMWNEPWVSLFWEGTPAQYVELCRIMYDEAKRQRPDITVYAQLFFEGPFAREAMKLGVLKYCDAGTYHYYIGTIHPQEMLEPVQKLRKMIAQYSDRDLPLMNSEGGVACTTFLRGLDFADLVPEASRPTLNYRQGAEAMVQANVVQMAAGIRAWYYYFFQPVAPDYPGMWKYENYSTVEVTRSPKPMVIAHCMLAWQLDGGEFVTEIKAPAQGFRAYLFQRKDGGGVAVTWSEDGATTKLALSEGLRATDMMGNPMEVREITIGRTPVYLRASSAETLATALKDPHVIATEQEPKAFENIDPKDQQPKAMKDFPIASELARDMLVPLDLSPVANMSLADDTPRDGKGGWMDEGPYNDMRNLQPGRHVWLGVPFDIAGHSSHDPSILTLKGKTFPNGPQQAGPIAVGHKLRGLFFVHAANWTQPGKEVGEYIIHYADGQEVKLPIVVGQNIGEWWYDHTEGEDSRTVAFGAADPIDPKQPRRFLRIWYWENTRPTSEIQSINVRSLSNEMTFTVVAVTAARQ